MRRGRREHLKKKLWELIFTQRVKHYVSIFRYVMLVGSGTPVRHLSIQTMAGLTGTVAKNTASIHIYTSADAVYKKCGLRAYSLKT